MQFGCNGLVKNFDTLFSLQDTLVKKYNVKQVEVKIKNQNRIEVLFVNSPYNDSTEEQQKRNAYAIKDFVRTVYHSRVPLERITVGFKTSNNSKVFPVSNTRSYDMAVDEEMNTGSIDEWAAKTILQSGTSVDSLGKYINLVAFKPSEVKWVMRVMKNPNPAATYAYCAYLQSRMTFDSASVCTIKNLSKVISTISPTDSLFKFDWLDKDYKWNNVPGGTTPISVYNSFVFESGSYKRGKFIICKNDILLIMYTQ